MELFKTLEAKHGLPSGLLDAVWATESSRGKNLNNSSAGARGHFQFMPETAKQYGIYGKENDLTASATAAARMYSDLMRQSGGTGAKADNFVFWAAQWIGREIRLLNHYEQQGQPLAAHLNWLRSQGYTPDRAQIWLPHDGDTQDKVHDVSYRSAFEQAGYAVTVIPNQGKGAAMLRVEAARRLFPAMWFNEATTQAGIDALGWYHEKRDEARGVGLGPEHDWASHSADAFGLMCVAYELPANRPEQPIVYKNRRVA